MASSSSSTVITHINSALDDVDSASSFLSSSFYFDTISGEQRFRLRNLKTFAIILTRKFGKDGSLGYLLTRIENAATRNSLKIPPNVLRLKDLDTQCNEYFRAIKRIVSDFQRDMQFIKQEIDERYIAMSNDRRQSHSSTADEWYIAMSYDRRQSHSLTADEVGEITDSILENLVDFSCFSEILAEPMEALRVHMNFLKNFRRFATKRGVKEGQMNDFLAHNEAVAIRAAHLCFLCEYDDDKKNWRKGMLLKISSLLQRIKPTDFQVCKTYAEALSCSKLSRRLDAPTHIQEMEDDSTLMKNFVDSLISILREMLQRDTHHVVSLKGDWQVLYEGLRSLRTILEKLKPNDRDDIGVLVCDAGVLVCSFYQRNVEIDIGLQDLLEKIEILGAEVGENGPQTSMFNPSSQPRSQTISEGVAKIQNGKQKKILGSMTSKSRRNLTVGGISDSFSMQFDPVMEDNQKIKADASKISNGKRQDIKVKEVPSTSSHVPSTPTASTTTEVVGFHNEAKSIMDRLQRGSKQLRVVAIVGMGGLGKTTLAAKVYDDPAVMCHFHVRARCTVSQTLDKRRLLLELLNQIHPGKYFEMTEDDLVEKLRKHLKGKRYLIFLDDIWAIEAWNSLQGSFPDDSKGSRIILTSRNHDAAPLAMIDEGPLYLGQLSKGESLELLRRKLFYGEVWPPALYDIGMQIVENCKWLPLTIVIVAGLLATTEQDDWKEIVDGLRSGVVSSTEQCMNSMQLSYSFLPEYLKPCFLYFGAFPEDQEVSVWRLIQLWIAEGFVWKGKWKSLQDAAVAYLKDLIGRSLIMVAEHGSMGGVKTCRIHDLLHEFCLRKAKDGDFLHLVKGYDELLAFNEPCNLRRLCIHSEPKHFKESKVFCPRARSLLFFSQKGYSFTKEVSINIFLIHIFKFVGVLDLEHINLGSVFPSEIELLVQLRYLAIRGAMRVIPSWVENLSMLETFIVDPCQQKVSLPDTIWNLRKLKFLCTRIILSSGGGVLPIENLDSSSVLYELDTFSGAVFICRGSMEDQMRKFPNICKLKCMLFQHRDDTDAFYNIGVPDFLTRLESLNMIWNGTPPDHIRCEFCFPANLKKLTLVDFQLPWSKISTIGELPNLEVLKLGFQSFTGKTWEMEEGEFPKLRYLKMHDLDLVRWTASDSDYQFPCLEKLVLARCRYLEEMPSCLESSPTLEMIEASYCPKATTLVKRIEELQVMSMGNSAFKIQLTDNDFEDEDEEEEDTRSDTGDWFSLSIFRPILSCLVLCNK